MCGSFILVCKMVTLGRMESPNLSPIHCKMTICQAVLRRCTRTRMIKKENIFLLSSPFREK